MTAATHARAGELEAGARKAFPMTVAPVLAVTLLLASSFGGAPTSSSKAGRKAIVQTPILDADTRILLGKLERLPDLRIVARGSFAKDPGYAVDQYAIQDELVQERRKERRPYRYSRVFRSPPGPCISGQHQVAVMDHQVVNFVGPALLEEKLEMTESHLHEIREHGEHFTDAEARFLARLP